MARGFVGLAGDQVELIVTVEVVLVSAVAELHAFEQVFGDGGIAGGGEEGREPVETGEDTVLHGVGGNVTGPA